MMQGAATVTMGIREAKKRKIGSRCVGVSFLKGPWEDMLSIRFSFFDLGFSRPNACQFWQSFRRDMKDIVSVFWSWSVVYGERFLET